ncbi:MAG: VirB4-like conjugal transfer ATPase, CD1110 family [Patescibacteria group bacterium]
MFNLFKKKENKDNSSQGNSSWKEDNYEEIDILNKKEIYEEGLTRILDFVAPSAMGVSSSHLQIGGVYCRTVFVSAYPRVLSSGWAGQIITLDLPMDISFYVHPVETTRVLKQLRKKATQIQSQLNIEAEKGYTRDPELEMAYQNVEELRDKLQEGVEKVFKFGCYVNVYAKDLDQLERNTSVVQDALESMSIYTKKAIFRMKEGFDSCLPLATDKLMIGSDLNTSPLATVFPFISSNVTSNQGIMYGINKHNNSLILFDKFSLENANMVVFAKSGAGKSYAVKLEILRSLMLGTDSIIIDPEDEYRYLAEAVGGSYISVSLNSSHHINPFELRPNEDEDTQEILRSSIADLLGLMKLMLGAVTPEEEAILERALKEAYAVRDITDSTPVQELGKKKMPLLTDFHQVLENMEGAGDLSIRLEKYVKGIYNGFLNQPSNISLNNRLIVFNIRDLEDELRPIAMYIILKYIWNEVRYNVKKRLITVDEAWWMMQYDEGASFLFSIAKRIRKYYGGLATITQDISDFMNSRYGKSIVSNSSLQLLMKQSKSSIDVVADTFYLTEREKYFLMETKVGEGIFFAGNKRAAIQVVASYNEDKIITTNPAQRMEIEKEKREK